DRFVEFGGEGASEVADLGRPTSADVEDLPIGAGIAGDEEVGAGDVFDEDEVAALVTVLVHERRLVGEEGRTGDGDDGGVGVEDGLARTVGAGVAEGNHRSAGGTAPRENETFLVEFADGVDVLAADRRVFVGRDGGRGNVADRTVDGVVAAI